MTSCIVIWSRGIEAMKKSVRCVLPAVLAVFLCVSVSVAQQITGSITGSVIDPTGAAVSGVAVKLTNSGTGVVQSTTTNSSGDFRFLLLPSGIYSLDATMSGFKTFRREGIVVEVDRS